MRRLLTVALALATMVTVTAPASADSHLDSAPPKVRTTDFNTITVSASEEEGKRSKPGPRWRRGRPSLPATVYSYWRLDWFDGDRFCLRRRSTTNERVARGAADGRWYRAFAEANDGVYSECPDAPTPTRSPQAGADSVARSFWDVRLLPTPVLEVVPNYAIAGKRVYLQIAGDAARRFEVANPLGDDVAIDATSRYVVDWGDGTVETTTSQGGPWPHGDVTHVYTYAEDVTITVTQVWSATWRAGSGAGDLAGLQTTATLPLRVTQLQAVRNR